MLRVREERHELMAMLQSRSWVAAPIQPIAIKSEVRVAAVSIVVGVGYFRLFDERKLSELVPVIVCPAYASALGPS